VVELPPAGSVRTSGVVMGLPLQSGFAPRLQFTSADTDAAVYVEVYGVPSCSSLSGTLEIASSDATPALTKASVSATQDAQSDACILFGSASIKALAVGDYTIRLAIQRNGETLGQRMRILRKTAR
jgi:hypothetical protein